MPGQYPEGMQPADGMQMVDENGNPVMQLTEEQFQQMQYQQQM
jgi:hypothetical protein